MKTATQTRNNGFTVKTQLRAGTCNLSLKDYDNLELYRACGEGDSSACQTIHDAGCTTDRNICPTV